MFKQAILVRTDLGMGKGKIAAQAAHASVEAALKADPHILKEWRRTGMKKIVLKVSSKQELYKYAQEVKTAGMTVAIITDAGHTQVSPGSVTCAACGPADEEKLDAYLHELSLL